MAEFAKPEMLRVSLVDICLKSKTVAGNLSIEEFLDMALTPPDIQKIRKSVSFLKKIDALDGEENLTSIGSQLANMPVDCQYGRMILTAILLGCVNPIITLVSMMSVNNIKITKTAKNKEQPQPEQNRAEWSMSDHRYLIDMYNEWSVSGRPVQFCNYESISQTAMQMVRSIRQQLKIHLLREHLVQSWNVANTYELSWFCVKAAITSGLQTNTAYVNDDLFIESNKHEKLKLHVSTRCRHACMTSGSIILYNSRIQTKSPTDTIRTISVVSPINIAIFGGNMQLKMEYPVDDDITLVDYRISDTESIRIRRESSQALRNIRFEWSAIIDKLCRNPRNFQFTLNRINLRRLVNSLMKEGDHIETNTTPLGKCFDDTINQNISLMQIIDVKGSIISERNLEWFFQNQQGYRTIRYMFKDEMKHQCIVEFDRTDSLHRIIRRRLSNTDLRNVEMKEMLQKPNSENNQDERTVLYFSGASLTLRGLVPAIERLFGKQELVQYAVKRKYNHNVIFIKFRTSQIAVKIYWAMDQTKVEGSIMLVMFARYPPF